MDDHRFDHLTRVLASGSSRRRVLGLLTGGLAVVFGGSKAALAQSNSECAHLCTELFPAGKERGDCISQGARGMGPCVSVGCDTNLVSVDALNSGWTSAGSFPAADTLTVTATGSAGHCPSCAHGPDGNFPCGAFACGQLIGTFDPSNPTGAFSIGSTETIPGSGTGTRTLYLLFYDVHVAGPAVAYSDNYGAYSVTVTNCAVVPV